MRLGSTTCASRHYKSRRDTSLYGINERILSDEVTATFVEETLQNFVSNAGQIELLPLPRFTYKFPPYNSTQSELFTPNGRRELGSSIDFYLDKFPEQKIIRVRGRRSHEDLFLSYALSFAK